MIFYFLYKNAREEIFKLEKEKKQLKNKLETAHKELTDIRHKYLLLTIELEKLYKVRDIKEKYELKEELDKLHKELSETRHKYLTLLKEFEKFFKVGEMYVVNVCALYIVSNKKIFLSGDRETFFSETKGMKYRPIVITSTEQAQIRFIALSTHEPKQDVERLVFEHKECKFFTKKCFIPKMKDRSYIFGITINRTKSRKIKGTIFSIPIEVFRELEHIEASERKNEVIQKCTVHPKNSKTGKTDYTRNRMNENYKLIKKCAICNEKYVKSLIDLIEE